MEAIEACLSTYTRKGYTQRLSRAIEPQDSALLLSVALTASPSPYVVQEMCDLPWTAPIRRPVRPWTLLAALLTVPAALLAALLTELAALSAVLLTLVRPSDALDWTLDEASAAFSFAAPAASDVFEALRTPARRMANRDWRTTARDTAKDIVMVRRRGWAMEMVWSPAYLAGWPCRARAFFESLALRLGHKLNTNKLSITSFEPESLQCRPPALRRTGNCEVGTESQGRSTQLPQHPPAKSLHD